MPAAEPPRRGGYPPIGDYGLIGDGHTVALVSRAGSIDWACLPDLHSASVFGRLLDWDLGGWCAISPSDGYQVSRRYLDQTLVLETTFTTPSGTVRLTDCLPTSQSGARHPDRELLRVVDGGQRVLRSALVLKALTNPRTGAIAAAPTTSLPERVGGGRNWDYRFSWLRDAALALHALAPLGFTGEAEGFAGFVQRSAADRAGDLQILSGIHGQRRLPEQTLQHLEGYRGSAPVRIGNAASRQLQLDVYGELLQLPWRLGARGRPQGDGLRLVPDDRDDQEARWAFVVGVVETAATRWREPDSGIWELRGAPRHLVHSKVACWAALDRGLRLAARSGRPAPLPRWRRVRDQIRAAVQQHGYERRRGIFTQAFGSGELDAALLQLPALGFVGWRDPRMLRTTDQIAATLGRGRLVRRYLADDGLAGGEGAFVACTFWLAECLARQGRLEQARTWFTRATTTANDLGLLAEQVDPGSGELLGNFPQGLSHLAHLAAAVALQRATAAADRDGAMQQPARHAKAIRRLPPMERTA